MSTSLSVHLTDVSANLMVVSVYLEKVSTHSDY